MDLKVLRSSIFLVLSSLYDNTGCPQIIFPISSIPYGNETSGVIFWWGLVFCQAQVCSVKFALLSLNYLIILLTEFS